MTSVWMIRKYGIVIRDNCQSGKNYASSAGSGPPPAPRWSRRTPVHRRLRRSCGRSGAALRPLPADACPGPSRPGPGPSEFKNVIETLINGPRSFQAAQAPINPSSQPVLLTQSPFYYLMLQAVFYVSWKNRLNPTMPIPFLETVYELFDPH